MTEDTQAAAESATSESTEEYASTSWFESEDEEELEASLKEYDITASPNDFNLKTIVDFVSRGVIQIPGFQRNFVWDIKRASKLIESLLIGLPIPQIFLYEEKRNSLLVIDGQQRLMSMYYFIKGRFPRREKRAKIRRILDEKKVLPDAIMHDDDFFQNFHLALKTKDGRQSSRFQGKNYQTLEDFQTSLDLRTIRAVVIKQNAPEEERDSSVFEIFNRLNTGGVNLRPQEIRSSLYRSDFTAMLHRVNVNPVWRRLIGLDEPDLHEKDIEILLRVFALVAEGESYKAPLVAFLNTFVRKARVFPAAKLSFIEDLYRAFFVKAEPLSAQDFAVAKSGRFNIAAFEAVFRASCTEAFAARDVTAIHDLSRERLNELRNDKTFINATQFGVGRTDFVKTRFTRAKAILQAM